MDWVEGNGTHENERHEIDTDEFYVICKLSVSSTGTYTHSTHSNPSEFNTGNQVIEVEEPELFIDGDEVELSEAQTKELTQAIIKSLKIQ